MVLVGSFATCCETPEFPCPHLEILRYPIVKTRISSWRYRYTKKAWIRLLSFHDLRPSHCLIFKNNNAKPTPNIKYTLCAILSIKVRMCAYVNTQKTHHNWHKKDNSISRRTSTVVKFYEYLWKLRSFRSLELNVNKRLFNMSATLRLVSLQLTINSW